MNPSISHTTTPARRTRPLTIGVAAGVLAGSAVGLVASSPGLTGAASEDSTTPTSVIATPDGTVDADRSEPPAEFRPEPGERLREMLQPLVDGGTIDPDQADAVAEFLAEQRPDRPEGRHGRRGLDGHGPNHAVVADLLGIDAETLRSELHAGKSVADIAEAQGVDVQVVIDGLVADAQSHLDLAVEHGLDEDQAAEHLAELTERIEASVNRTRPADAVPADG